MSLLPGVNYVGGREEGCLTSPPLEWTGLHTLFATPSQFVVAQALAGAATAAHAPKGLLGHERRYAIDAAKITTELGCKPRHSLEQGLEATVRWYLANLGWCDQVRQRAGYGGGERIGVASAVIF
jgi:hypothetical protein